MTLFEVSRGAASGRAPRRIPSGMMIGGAFVAAVVVVGVVASAMAINGWMTTARESPSPLASAASDSTAASAADGGTASTGPSVDPEAPFPTAAEARLLGLLDERDRERCQRAPAEDTPIYTVVLRITSSGANETRRAPVPYDAGIDCALGGFTAPDRLLYWDIRSPAGSSGVFTTTGDASTIVFQLAGRLDAQRGSCDDGAPALESWSFGDASGDMVCYESTTGDAVIVWSVDDSRLLGRAVRDDRDMAALLDWWRDEGRFAE